MMGIKLTSKSYRESALNQSDTIRKQIILLLEYLHPTAGSTPLLNVTPITFFLDLYT